MSTSTIHIKSQTQFNLENLDLIFQSYYQSKSITTKSFSISNHENEVGEHFQSEILRISIKFSNGKEIKLLIKEPLKSSKFQKLFSKIAKPYMRESFWYMQAVPTMKSKFPEVEEISPKCFHGVSTYQGNYKPSWAHKQGLLFTMALAPADEGVLLLEDLKEAKMTTLDKNKIASVDIVKLVMKSLAKFHGVWLVWMKNQEPKFNGLDKTEILEGFAAVKMRRKSTVAHFKVLKSFEKQMVHLRKPPELIQAFKNFRSQANKIVRSTHPSNLDGKLLTMVHGDLWTNNFLVDENQTQIKFIDFQQMHPGHPSRDFWYYLYSCTDLEWRKLHLEEVMKSYFTHLLPYLKEAQMEVNFEDFRQEMNQFRATGFLLAFIVLPIILHPGIPSPPDLKTWKGFKQFYAWRDEIFSRPIKYNEHSMVKEINRRLLENIEEAFMTRLF